VRRVSGRRISAGAAIGVVLFLQALDIGKTYDGAGSCPLAPLVFSEVTAKVYGPFAPPRNVNSKPSFER
jgi:hypothetical protein